MGRIDDLDEEKFIVINRKRFDELNATFNGHFIDSHPSVAQLNFALYEFGVAYKADVGKPLDQRYIVCNQDEPYAEEVARIILEGESKKESNRG